jgi:uncharacterized membrane protein YcaP (DUF421 family)
MEQGSDWWNWERILIGEVPMGFMLEAILRVGFVYLLLLMSMRILGKKMASQLTRNEMAAMVCLASAVGVPILSPERGLLPALVICITIVSLSRLVVHFSSTNQKIESLTLGSAETLIDNGVMNVKTMERTGLSRQRVFAQLRSSQIFHLGEVNKLFFEANGKFTLVRATEKRPGLAVLPNEDPDFLAQLSKTYTFVCDYCGYLNNKSNKNSNCPSCGRKQWKLAITNAENSPEKVAVAQQPKEVYHG